MDSDRFDALTRRLRSRRTALAGLLGGAVAILGSSPEKAASHNPVPACKEIADSKRRLACLRRARAHNRTKHACKPRPLATFCSNRCGTTQNNCRKRVNCTCPAGKSCLANFGCNRTCSFTPFERCPAGCACGALLMENQTITHCFVGTTPPSCDQIPLPCVTSANCPRGSFCGLTTCGPGGGLQYGRCIPTCPF